MFKQTIIFSYDLGIEGDYKKLYKWLDSQDAKECGDSVCIISYEFQSISQMADKEDTRKALREIYDDLVSAGIEFRLNDRIYVASEFYWNNSKALRGGFIVGKRKPNPWEGFASEGKANFEVE